jgi:hypothetical protein
VRLSLDGIQRMVPSQRLLEIGSGASGVMTVSSYFSATTSVSAQKISESTGDVPVDVEEGEAALPALSR